MREVSYPWTLTYQKRVTWHERKTPNSNLVVVLTRAVVLVVVVDPSSPPTDPLCPTTPDPIMPVEISRF